jgi:hypothetical protein
MNDFITIEFTANEFTTNEFERINDIMTNDKRTNDIMTNELMTNELARMHDFMTHEIKRPNDFMQHEFERSNDLTMNSKQQDRIVRTQEMLLMSRESSQQQCDEIIMREMSDEMMADLSARLELEGDQVHDQVLLQQEYDIMYEMNVATDRIIEAFELLHHGDSSDDDEFYRFPPLQPGEDIDENTDTEDGHDEFIDLVKSNMKLLEFVLRQRETIARLRARIFRLSDVISKRTIQPNRSINKANESKDDIHASSMDEDIHASSVRNITLKGNHSSSVNSPTNGYFDDGSSATAAKRSKLNAFVLVDSTLDVSLSSMSTKFNPKRYRQQVYG